MVKPALETCQLIIKSDYKLFEHILALDGLVIVGRQTNTKHLHAEAVRAVASILTEDPCEHLELTKRQSALIALATRHGYLVALQEGLDQSPGTEVGPLKAQLNHPDDEQEPPDEEEGEEAPPTPPV